jgi:hypothetical protein
MKMRHFLQQFTLAPDRYLVPPVGLSRHGFSLPSTVSSNRMNQKYLVENVFIRMALPS